MDERRRLFLGSSDRHTSQSQHSEGMPVDVPDPRKRMFMVNQGCPLSSSMPDVAERIVFFARTGFELYGRVCDVEPAFEKFLNILQNRFELVHLVVVKQCVSTQGVNIRTDAPDMKLMDITNRRKCHEFFFNLSN